MLPEHDGEIVPHCRETRAKHFLSDKEDTLFAFTIAGHYRYALDNN